MSEEVFEPKPIPLPKELYEKAAKLKTKTVELVFYGNGLDYEDRITYDIKKKTVSTWGFTIEKVTKRKTKYVEKQETKKEIEVQ